MRVRMRVWVLCVQESRSVREVGTVSNVVEGQLTGEANVCTCVPT
jgi:triosephosphate isomerase